MSNTSLIYLIFVCACIVGCFGRLGLVVPNTFESHPLVCPGETIWTCDTPGAFVSTRNVTFKSHLFYEGYILCPEAEVVIVTTGLASLNAVLTTQMLLDLYDDISLIITWGIAGGIDPDLHIGDVNIATFWAQHNLWNWQRGGDSVNDMLAFEVFGDYTREHGSFTFDNSKDDVCIASNSGNNSNIDSSSDSATHSGRDRHRGGRKSDPNSKCDSGSTDECFGNVWWQGQEVFRDIPEVREHIVFFEADNDSLNAIELIKNDLENSLENCLNDTVCLTYDPKIVTGGIGISGDIFVDNAKFRTILYDAWNAQSVDMETAAVAMTAVTNNVPFVAFRSISDLAGGSEQANEGTIFENLAVSNALTILTGFIDYQFC